MYEFVDGHGELVTVRSDRTLERLLSTGRITATTKFRLETERTFVAAAEHPAALASAEQAGVRLADCAVPQPSLPDRTGQVRAPDEQPVSSANPVLVPPVETEPVLFRPKFVSATVRPPAKDPNVRRGSVPSTPPRRAPPETSAVKIGVWPRAASSSEAPDFLAAFQGAGMAFVACLACIAAGAFAGLIMEAMFGNTILGVLAVVVAAAFAARFAGRKLAVGGVVSRLQVAGGGLVFLCGCVLTGWSGTLVGLPLCFVLWTAFSDNRLRT